MELELVQSITNLLTLAIGLYLVLLAAALQFMRLVRRRDRDLRRITANWIVEARPPA